jgi:protein O-mannosyl-transferase
MTLFQAGRYAESIAASNKALSLVPGHADAWNNIFAAYNAIKRWDDAISACNEAIEIRPDCQLARNNLAWAVRGKAESANESAPR